MGSFKHTKHVCTGPLAGFDKKRFDFGAIFRSDGPSFAKPRKSHLVSPDGLTNETSMGPRISKIGGTGEEQNYNIPYIMFYRTVGVFHFFFAFFAC